MRRNPEREDMQYLELRRSGRKIKDIAALFRVSDWTVKQGIRRSRDLERQAAMIRRAADRRREPSIELRFGSSCKALGVLTCGDVHPGGPIPKGDPGCCPICHQSGKDHHPTLSRIAGADPRPEPKPPAKPLTKPRRQARKPKTCAV